MMTLTVRKVVVLGLIGTIFLMANILVVANWLSEKGVADKASWLREEFLTGTAIAVVGCYSYCTSSLNRSESSLKHVLSL